MGHLTTRAALLEAADFAEAFGWDDFPGESSTASPANIVGFPQQALPPIPLNDHSGRTEDYPLDCLGAYGERAAMALHHVTQAPKGLCAQAVLCAMSICVSSWGQVESITGDIMPLALYLITVAQSGERKSATDALAQKGVRVFENETAKVVRDMIREAVEVGSSTDDVPMAEILINDPTLEGMLKVMERGQGFACLSNDDAAGFFGGHSMNRDNRQKMIAALSQLWSGTSIVSPRANGKGRNVSGVPLTMSLMFQPYMIGQVFGDREMVEQGILARVLPCYPVSTMGTRLYRKPDPANKSAVDDFARRCFEVIGQAKQNRAAFVPSDDPFAPAHPVLPLSDEACDVLVDFYNEVEAELGHGGAYAAIRAFAGRATENATRLAGIITLFDETSATEVSRVAAKAAVRLARFYLAEFSYLLKLGRTSRDHSAVAQLGTWLAQKYGAAGVGYDKDVSQYGPSEFRKAGARKPAMELLAAHRWIEMLPAGTVVDGAKRQEAFRVSPDIAAVS